jgi:glutathione S-transferase
MTYRLYYSTAACSMAPHIALEETGEPFELELVSSRGEREGAMTATAEWRAKNPKGRIPALLGVPGSMGGLPDLLTEVPAILAYLALRHPGARLLPKEPAEFARCLEWMNWLSSNVHAISYGQIWRTQRYSSRETCFESIRDMGRRNLADQYRYVEQVLSDGREWSSPTGYTIVDAYFLVFFQWGQRIGIGMRELYPRYAGLIDKVLARPAVQRVLAREGVEIQ